MECPLRVASGLAAPTLTTPSSEPGGGPHPTEQNLRAETPGQHRPAQPAGAILKCDCPAAGGGRHRPAATVEAHTARRGCATPCLPRSPPPRSQARAAGPPPSQGQALRSPRRGMQPRRPASDADLWVTVRPCSGQPCHHGAGTGRPDRVGRDGAATACLASGACVAGMADAGIWRYKSAARRIILQPSDTAAVPPEFQLSGWKGAFGPCVSQT